MHRRIFLSKFLITVFLLSIAQKPTSALRLFPKKFNPFNSLRNIPNPVDGLVQQTQLAIQRARNLVDTANRGNSRQVPALTQNNNARDNMLKRQLTLLLSNNRQGNADPTTVAMMMESQQLLRNTEGRPLTPAEVATFKTHIQYFRVRGQGATSTSLSPDGRLIIQRKPTAGRIDISPILDKKKTFLDTPPLGSG